MKTKTDTAKLYAKHRRAIERDIRKREPTLKRGTDEWLAQAMLLASACVGPYEDKIAAMLDVPAADFAHLAAAARRNGIWKRGRVRADWFDDKYGETAFLGDVCCVLGWLERA